MEGALYIPRSVGWVGVKGHPQLLLRHAPGESYQFTDV